MAYVKNTWVDQNVERPKTYEVTNNQDGSITLTDSFGLVTELGTPVNATNMNHIEDGLADTDVTKYNATTVYSAGEWVTGTVNNEKGIYSSLVNNNVGNALTDTTKWGKINLGGADLDLSNITNIAKDMINQSKALETGSVSTNPDVYAWIKSMKDNSFDKAKFTVNGNAVIHNNGIFELTSANTTSDNVLTTDTIDITSANTWELYFRYQPNANGGVTTFFQGALQIQTYTINDDYVMYYFITKDINNHTNVPYIQPTTYTFAKGVNSDFKITGENDGNGNTVCKVYMKLASEADTEYRLINSATTTVTGGLFAKTGKMQFGYCANGGTRAVGVFDLKKVKVVIDGIKTFVGQATGVDTIKPDDYTIVGTPTISEDGVVSGFSSSNYLTSTSIIDWTKKYELIIKCHTPSSWNNAYETLCGSADTKVAPAIRNFNGVWNVDLSDLSITTTHTILLDSDYILKLTFDGIDTYKLFANGEQIGTTTGTSSLTQGAIALGRFLAYNADRFWTGSIDLNASKIYVDGNLVYQPCLKIPYTLSKTGSKIVDSQYRDRVADMYKQFGYAPYYTLSNTNFTLPMGEIYGMISRSNFTPTGKYIDLALGAAGNTYIMPADGYLYFAKKTVTAYESGGMAVMDSSYNGVDPENHKIYCVEGYHRPDGTVQIILPVYKNANVYVNWSLQGETKFFRFVYAKSGESEV